MVSTQRIALDHAPSGGLRPRERPGLGGRPTVRFVVAATLTAGYVAMAVTVSASWRSDLEAAVGPVLAWVIPILLAYVPGLVIGFMIFTLLTLRYRVPEPGPPAGPWPPGQWPPLTVVVAAWNEAGVIAETLERIAAAQYGGQVEVILADNNSTDDTATIAAETAERCQMTYRRVFEASAGKHRALNTALATVSTPLVVTVDADTLVHPEALTFLVGRVTSHPQGQQVCACAGALIVNGERENLLTRMQGWDYRLGINGVKRMQSAYNSALVAQGAFSVYWTDDLLAVGGWPDAIGEDIVLTWTLMNARGIVQYEPCALAFTAAPTRVVQLMRQRSRWARGMFESLGRVPPRHQPRVLAKLVASIDYLVPLLDIGYVFFWVPGVILFLFGYPLLFSWWSMLVIPVTLVVFGLMRRWQERHVFRRLDVSPQPDVLGFLGYLFVYQAITSTAALRGYAQHMSGASRRWR